MAKEKKEKKKRKVDVKEYSLARVRALAGGTKKAAAYWNKELADRVEKATSKRRVKSAKMSAR